jgi:hypothetical protein
MLEQITFDFSDMHLIHPLDVLEKKLVSFSPDELNELGNPSCDIFDVARKFVTNYPEVNLRFRSVCFDYDGGLLLEFTENLVIGISFHKAFFPSINSQLIDKYYLDTELDQLVDKFFPKKISNNQLTLTSEQAGDSFDLAA